MAFSSADSIVNELKRRLGLTEDNLLVLKLWEQELGPLASQARIEGIQNGTLIVEVTSSAHFQEVSLLKKKVAAKINQYFGGKKVVKGIKIKLKK